MGRRAAFGNLPRAADGGDQPSFMMIGLWPVASMKRTSARDRGAQGLRLLDGKHGLVLDRGRFNAELFKLGE